MLGDTHLPPERSHLQALVGLREQRNKGPREACFRSRVLCAKPHQAHVDLLRIVGSELAV
eukprot:787869-Amphidinium_carterae.1